MMLEILLGKKRKNTVTHGVFRFNSMFMTTVKNIDLSVALQSLTVSTAVGTDYAVAINNMTLTTAQQAV